MTVLNGIATESAGVLELTPTKVEGVFDNIIIREGWGQSGYYPGDVLHRDGPKVFKAGTRIFLDHAEGPIESAERTIGVLQEDARADKVDGRAVLRAPMRFFKTGVHNIDWIKERAEAKAIEVSIRSGVKYSAGEREGRYGKVVTAMTEAFSVDVVARGGAGGSFGTIQESAPVGVDHSENQEGEIVPVSKEEINEIATAFAEALAPKFETINTSLGDLAKSQKVEETKLVALKPSEIAAKIAAGKLSEKATERVYAAAEAEGVVPTAEFIDREIGREADIAKESRDALIAEKGDGFFEEAGAAGGDGAGKPTGAYKPGAISAWAVKK